ncbi:MAG: hypothetical protein J6B77_07475, partial [Clostridia bacterium]|nr:hypothetical protein [Clostridia bacterium]
TIAEAIAAAKKYGRDGYTITVKLLKDLEEENVSVINNVTFDLNGHTLTATYFAAFYDSDVIDSTKDKSGRLIVAHNRIALPEDNVQMPICIAKDEDTGVCTYLFAEVTLKNMISNVNEDGFKITYAPKFGTDKNSANNDITKNLNSYLNSDNIENSHISFIVRLSWITNGIHDSQDFLFDDENVGSVYSNNKAMTLTLSGMKGYTDVIVSVIVVSETGVEMEEVAYIFNETATTNS